MSPEQAKGEAVDGRSDIFSLGTILYQMLTGQRAFDAPNVPAILSRVTHDAPLSPLLLAPALPPEVERILARAMAKEPAQRYADGQELAEDIEDVLAGRPLKERPGLATALEGSGLASARSPVPREANEISPQTLAGTATASLIDRTARVDTLDTGDPDWAGGPSAPTPGPPPAAPPLKPRHAMAPGLALAGMLIIAALSGAVAVTLTRGREAGAAPPPETTPAAPGEGLTATPSEPDPSGVAHEAGASPSQTAGPGPLIAVSNPPARNPGSGLATSAPSRNAPGSQPGDSGWVAHSPSAAETGTRGSGPATRADPPRPPPPTRGPAPALLLLRVEHSLKRGELRVSAPDGSLVFRHRLRGEEGKTLGVFTTHKGGLEQTIEVPPGTYFVRVEAIEDEDKKKAGLLRGVFRSGQTRVLEVKVAANMELRWR
jgi:serine/threonine-protein kinase